MTEKDKKLIEEAERLVRYDYRQIDDMIKLADTEEARYRLKLLRWEKYDLCVETC